MCLTHIAAAAGIAAFTLHAQADWPAFTHDPGAQRYSPLTQISAKNVGRLKPAWQYGIRTPEARPGAAPSVVPTSEVTPIVAGGLMYFPTSQRAVVALEPETGKEVWKYDLGEAAAPRRGVTYWPGDKQNVARVFVGTGDGR